MDWSNFGWWALPAAALWLAAGAAVYRRGDRLATLLMAAGILLLAVFIAGFWITLGRPPMRTMGETRLWYSFFLSGVGFVAWRRWKYPWLLGYSAVVATVFVLINILKPEIHSAGLMPALQSVWFVPHVTSYILSYAMLGAATIGAFVQLYRREGPDPKTGRLVDDLVAAGFGLLVAGMLMGAVWAKQAWGHYWEWDPKETWALVTALAYLAYIHLRLAGPRYERTALWLLPVAFLMLLVTWLGVAYLPSAEASVHVY